MKTIIKTFCAAMVALFTTTAFAVDPVAVWSGFNNLESGTFIADIGSLVPDAKTGAVTLGSSGIKFANSGDAWSGSTKGWTVAIKYSTFTSGTAAALVSLQQNSETSAAGIDKIGAWVNANGKVQGLWQAGSYGTANGTLPASGVFFVRYNDGNGTSVHMQNGTSLYAAGGLKSSNNNWGKSFAVGSFANGTSNVAAGLTVEAVAIFDSRISDADMGAYEFPEPESGVEYETFTHDGFLTTTFVDTGWNFDLSKLEECVITGTMSGSSIANKPAPSNGYWAEVPDESGVAKFQMQVYQYNSASDHWLKAVEVELKQGDNGTVLIRGVRAGYADGGATDPKGSIKISDWNSTLATSATTQAYGVNKVVIKVPAAKETYTGKVISVNVTQGGTGYINADQTTPLGTFPANAWTQQSSEARGAGNAQKIDFSTAAEYNVNTAAKTDVSAKVFGIARDAGNFGRRDVAGDIAPATGYDYLYCWMSMKDGTQGTTYLNAEVPYETYDVYLYFSAHKVAQKSGGAAPAIRSFVIGGAHSSIDAEPTGGTRYTVDASGALVVSSDANATWGDGSIADVQVGKNYVVLENQSGAFSLLMNGSSGGLAAVQFAERTSGKKKVEVDCGTEYLMSEANAVEGDAITLKFANAGGKLLVDEAPSRKYTIKCAGSMEILGDDYTITQTDFNKLTLTQVSGGLTIDATGGLEMNDAVKSAIKSATANKTYTFIGAGNNGATLDFTSPSNTKTLKTHLVFDGGTHTFKQNGAENSTLLSNGSIENPSIFVTGGATFTLMGKDVTGYSGAYIANGVIKVDDGATLVMRRLNSGDTFFYRQQVCLMSGATMRTYGSETIELYGGAADGVYEIYVPDSAAGNTKAATITGNFQFRVGNSNDNIAAYVGENSILKVEKFASYSGNDATLYKRGAGKLEFTGSGTTTAVNVQAGSLGLNGTINDLTFGAEGVLNLDNGAPTITGSLVTATEKQLKLAITSPVHGMPVITLPAAVDKTGWTARVNGREAENELIAEGNTLKLKWKIPPTITVDINDITIEPTSDWNGGTVKIDVSGLDKGDYKEDDDITYRLRFGDTTVDGEVEGNSAIFTLPDTDFTAGNIYRGTFELGYGDAGDTITAADVIVYEGKLTYGKKDPWVNETPTTLGETGTYDPESGVLAVDNMIRINTNKEVTFTPNPDPDYADKCDSSFTISIIADEAIDDSDQTIEDGAQAGVQIVADNTTVDGVKFQFIVGDKWRDGPKAALNTLYDVTISFHYAKEEGDEDSVTYTVKDLTHEPVVADRRENTANKVEEIIFYDGTQFASLVGTCQIESADPSADPVAQGIKPGEEVEITADTEEEAKKQAEKIPVLIPDYDEDVVAALNTDEKKEIYKALFKVVAVKKENGSYTAEVVFTELAERIIKEDEKNILTEVVDALGSLLGGDNDTLENIKGQPGLYYGIASDGELVNMGEAAPEEWVIANGDGDIVGLKVKKAANAKQGFYKVICTPKPTKKDK